MVRFREDQRFRQWWLLALLLVPVAPFAYGMYVQLVLGRKWGTKPISEAGLLVVGVLVLGVPVWFWFLRLITEVHDDAVHVHFIPLWRKRIIPIRDIRTAVAVTYRPLRDYGGWGIRWGPRGQAYNVSGDRGVQLELANGKRLLIGSQRPEELEAAIGRPRVL